MRVPTVRYVQGRNAYGTSTKYGIAIHNTSNDASAADEAAYATRRTDGTSAHLYVDDTTVVQSLDTSVRAGHAGSDHGNSHAIAVEITGGNGWTRKRWLASVAWNDLGRALAAVIRRHWPDGSFKVRRATVAEMKANPKVKAFYGHDDMRRAWGGTDHTDPGPNFPWDRLFSAVNTYLIDPSTSAGDDMPTAKEIADAVLGRKFREYVDENGNTVRDFRTVSDLLWATHRGVIRNGAEQKLRDEAILAAVQGLDTAAVLGRIDTLAGQITAQAGAEAARDADLRAVLEQHADGTVDAEAVVARIGQLLTGDQPDAGGTPPPG